MRRATSKLLSLSKTTTSSSTSFISHNYTTQISQNLVKIQKTHNFQHNPCHYFNTHVEIPSNLPPRESKTKERSNLDDAFEAAKTGDEMVELFNKMEGKFDDETELGITCLRIGQQLDEEGKDFEKILYFGKKALACLDVDAVVGGVDDDQSVCLPLAMTLQLLGTTCYNLKKYNDALGYLDRAKDLLVKLDFEGTYESVDINHGLYIVHVELANVKTALGKREEALEDSRKSLEVMEFLLGGDSREVGDANRNLAEACVAILNFEKGLPYCLKALEVHSMLLGDDSVEVAHDRRLLGVIYTGMDEHGKALEQNQLAQKVYKKCGCSSELLRSEIDSANMNISLGKYEAAIKTLEGVVQQTEKNSENRALVFISMGKALVNQSKLADAKRCLEIACDVIDKLEKATPLEIAEAYVEISMQYETMNEFEIAITLLKRALALVEKLPREQSSVGSVSSRIGWLLMLTGKVAQAIPFLESAAEYLKESFGPKHFGVGYIYNNLGTAYLELEKPQLASEMFAVAKDIMDASLGPHHSDSIDVCQNLSKAYDAMGSNALAIEFQEKAVDAWQGNGQAAVDKLREARRILKQLRDKVCGVSSKDSSQSR